MSITLLQAGSGSGGGGGGGPAADSNGNHDFGGALEGSHSAIFGGSGGGSFGGSGGGFGGSFGNAPMENGNTSTPMVCCHFASSGPWAMISIIVISGSLGAAEASADILAQRCPLFCVFLAAAHSGEAFREPFLHVLCCCAQCVVTLFAFSPSYHAARQVQTSEAWYCTAQAYRIGHIVAVLCMHDLCITGSASLCILGLADAPK